MTERRRFLRFNTALSALCEIVSDKCKITSKIRNISKDGALLMLNRPLTQGTEIKISMDVPGDNIPIFADCDVAWQKNAQEEKDAASYQTGVRFKNMNNADRGRLLEYIYQQWLKLLDKPSK